ncbi:TOS1 protein [Plectosphaerella cucumerina]|uniref:glucan endo-1,3-beta-D-glucosidase n=1 Tax=Plectosphaerella cucumerina TaxID=40658 RepID=A0A8K0TQS8_9PEZI|nr:TOS1 protein [Plectosphaerella cucumerina]
MKSSAILALGSAAMATAFQQCSGSAKNEGGNWFCGAVDHILYSNVGHPGTYKAVSHMGSDGSCKYESKEFSGPLAPYNEELTALFRGPMNLAQFAVYNLNGNAKRDSSAQPSLHSRRQAHAHGHAHAHQKRGLTIFKSSKPAEAAPQIMAEVPEPEPSPEPTTTSSTSTKEPEPTLSEPSQETGGWNRIGYYNAKEGVADGITFLGNYGGEGSGSFDNVWGNSLSYLNSKASGGASSPQVLENVFIPSNKEFAIYSDRECKDGSCGYYRPGAVAYHGFPGDSKVFLFEFDMPLDGNTGFNGDMPAVWTLNAKIPRTQQYGDCSCWQSDCGEFDIYEVLAPGDTKCKSTFHTNVDGGSSDYFKRPVNGLIKVATVFDAASGAVSVKELPSDVKFSAKLAEELVQSWIDTEKDTGAFSLFSLAN